jgi:glutathione S-transferase
MASMKLTYFDFPGGRGEDCRMALFVAGVEFEDNRIQGPIWRDLKGTTPYGSLPVLELEGKPPLAQSNAILTTIGRAHGLLPSDTWEAGRHLAILEAVEELRAKLAPSGDIKDEGEKQRVREELSQGYLQTWAANIEKQIAGPYVSGKELQVADLKLFTVMNWLRKGVVDHVPPDVFGAFSKLNALFDAVEGHPKVAEWRRRFT